MDQVHLGRTDLKVSVMGLGCGGHSKLGLNRGHSQDDAIRVVHSALDLGINIIDTAESYHTEAAIGKAICDRRDRITLATKYSHKRHGIFREDADIVSALEQSLKALQADYIDIYQVHAVGETDYSQVVDHHLPVLDKLRTQGKIRYLGITEAFGADSNHRMLTRAVEDDYWDTIMVGFNFMNPSARTHVLKTCQQKGIGTLCMFAIRRALTREDLANQLVQQLIEEGKLTQDILNLERPFDFLLTNGIASNLADAGYRFCRHEPGIDVVLSGSGNPHHLALNKQSLHAPPLPETILSRLDQLFGHLDTISCN